MVPKQLPVATICPEHFWATAFLLQKNTLIYYCSQRKSTKPENHPGTIITTSIKPKTVQTSTLIVQTSTLIVQIYTLIDQTSTLIVRLHRDLR